MLLPRPPCPFIFEIPVVALPRLLVAHMVALLVDPVAIPVALMLPLLAPPELLELSLISVVFVPSSGLIELPCFFSLSSSGPRHLVGY